MFIEVPENQGERSTVLQELSIENLDIQSNYDSNYATDKIISAFPEKND